MDTVIRAVATFFFLMLVFRISGKRSLAEITTFDAVLLLIISEATQEAMTDGDQSMTNAFLLILTLIGLNMLMQQIGTRWPAFDKVTNSTPLVLIEDGHIHQERLKRMRVTEDDILEEARARFGVERLEQIKHAVLERSGGITVIPKQVSWANPDTYQELREAREVGKG
jgi:uncharacterized membrane protein YcaP (DUF421 family)